MILINEIYFFILFILLGENAQTKGILGLVVLAGLLAGLGRLFIWLGEQRLSEDQWPVLHRLVLKFSHLFFFKTGPNFFKASLNRKSKSD